MAAKRGIAGIWIALACAACASSHASDDLKLKTGGYSAVPSEAMNDEDAGAAPSGTLDGADYVEDSDSVLKDLRLAFITCDSPRNPKTFVPGSETINLEVGPDGKVTTVTPEARQGLTDDIDLCLRRVAMSAEFAPLAGGRTAKFQVPIVFTRTPLKHVH